MSKLNRRELDEDMEDGTEALQGLKKPILTNPYVNMGKIGLRCYRCEYILEITRGNPVNLTCPKCGKDKFLALSEFRMLSPNQEKTVFPNDIVERGTFTQWKLI